MSYPDFSVAEPRDDIASVANAGTTTRHCSQAPLDPSRYDELTGEMNRSHMAEVLQATLEAAAKLRASCGFLLVAIDELDRINGAHGSGIADEVVAEVAKRLRSQLRGKDHLGRFSGDEFGVILNDCTPDDLVIAADRLLTSVRGDVARTSAGPIAVTVTIGGVTAPRHARTMHDVLCRAQEALDAGNRSASIWSRSTAPSSSACAVPTTTAPSSTP